MLSRLPAFPDWLGSVQVAHPVAEVSFGPCFRGSAIAAKPKPGMIGRTFPTVELSNLVGPLDPSRRMGVRLNFQV